MIPVGPRRKTWGGEIVEEDGAQRFAVPGLENVEFELFPVTKFVSSQLPPAEQSQELEYAWMTGDALEAYERWSKVNASSPARSSLEVELGVLLTRLNFWALMFAPEGDRLRGIATVTAGDAVRMLRHGLSDVSECEGFLAVSSEPR